jgi:hypothetical protein
VTNSQSNAAIAVQSPAPARAEVATEAQRAVEVARAAQQEAAQAAAQAAREAAEAGRQAAIEGAREAARAQREAARAVREAQREAREAAREGQTVQPPWVREFPGGGPQIPDGAIIISIAFFVMCAVIAIGFPLARAFARRMDRKSVTPAIDSDTRVRLERIEHAVDAIAVEVERISEGQRYSSKVLAEMRALPEAEPAAALATPMLRSRERR